MKRTNIIIAVVLVALSAFFIYVGFTSSGNKKREHKEKVQKAVDFFVVYPTDVSSDITVTGSLTPYDEVELKNEVSGRIVMVNLPEGKFVRKGTLLVKLYDDDLQAALRKMKSQLAIQRRIYKRQSQLIKVNGISQNEFEQTILQINSITADISQQNALIRKTEVRAPFDGTIGLRNVSVGAVVGTSTSLATIRTNQKLRLDFFVPEKYSPTIAVGMRVNFTMADDKTLFTARVMATEQGIDNTTRNLKVRAVIESHARSLIPGAFAHVNLRLADNTRALMIPSQAIIPEEETKQVIVARHGKAHFVTVLTGIRQASKVEVTDGIEAGDTIITTGILFLKEGDKLKYSIASQQQRSSHHDHL